MEIKRPPVYRAGKPRPFAIGTTATGARGIVFLSGATGADPETGKEVKGIKAQTRIAMEHIKKSLEGFGTSLSNILYFKVNVAGLFPDGLVTSQTCKDMYEELEDFWKKYCPEFCVDKTPPASTLVGVTALAWPELLVEFEVVAAIP